jgi:hypothetical protein
MWRQVLLSGKPGMFRSRRASSNLFFLAFSVDLTVSCFNLNQPD